MAKNRRFGRAAILRRLATLPLESELEVEDYFVTPLLGLLGYEFPRDVASGRQHPVPGFQRVGRRQHPVVYPDRVVSAFGRVVLIVEPKAAGHRLTRADAEQATSYARLPRVAAARVLLTNGRELQVWRATRDEELLRLDRGQLPSRFAELDWLIGRDTLGRSIGELLLQTRVGEGAFAEVFKAWNPHLQRHEAVKVYRADVVDGETRQRVRRGLATVGRLAEAHPGITPIYGVHEAGAALAVAMYFSPGVTLERWAQRRLSFSQKIDVFARVCDAMRVAHAHRIIHRDLKPANVMVERRGQMWWPLVVDFDTAHVVGADLLTRTSERIGTLGYVAPEMLEAGAWVRRGVGARADVFGLGAILHYMLFGTPPVPREHFRLLERRIQAARAIPARTRIPLLHVLTKSLSPEWEARYAHAGELLDDVTTGLIEARTPLAHWPRQFVERVLAEARQLFDARRTRPGAPERTWRALNQGGWFETVARDTQVILMYDDDYRGFLVGYSLDSEPAWRRYRRSAARGRLRRRFGSRLDEDPPTDLEEAGATVFHRLTDLFDSEPSAVVARLLKEYEAFFRAWDPAR